MNSKIFVIFLVMSLVVVFGCVAQTIDLLGTWKTEKFIFSQTISFEPNGTGVFDTALGNAAFKYEIVANNSVRIDFYPNDLYPNGKSVTYSFNRVNQTTLILDNDTYVKVE
ncbi:MAG: hypothetical protein Q7S21_02255 [archaeon]|nr:hypothetical protein [archaeon]